MGWLLNIFRRWRRRRVEYRFLVSLQSEAAEEFLILLLKLMGLAFKLDSSYRRNIQGFKGKYQFKSQDGSVTVAALFTGKDLKVKEATIPNPDVLVVFKNGRALMNFLLSTERDILKLLLNNEVVIRGNANYVFKFGFLANNLQLALVGGLT